eukprot:XP_011663415.1 PREDICTED: plexin-A4-like [Strongylocentrotus purpuratus]
MAGVYFLKIRGLLPVLTVLFICLTQTIYSAPLSSYLVSRFTSPDPTLPFNHITINNITGEVYIGARQRLYQLNSDLTLKHTVDTGQCPSPNGNTNNNKLLLVAPSPEDKLITCGSCDGYCETRSLTNISHDVVRYETSSGQLVVTVTSDAPTVGAVVLGADYVPNGESTLDDGLYLFTGISDVTLSFPSVSKYSFVDLSTVQNVLPPQTLIPQNINHLIAYMEYLYYFISRGDSVYLGRLCRNSLDLRFASYTEIELQCESDNVIQSAHIGPAGSQLGDSLNIESTDDLLYAIFTSGSSSALCFYKMSDVQQRFEDAVLGCIQEDNNELGTTNDYFGDYSFCKSFPDTYTLPDTAQCTAYFRDGDEPPATQYQYASGTVPLSASPIITIPDVTCTSIVTTIERQHTVAFMGDTQGNIHKGKRSITLETSSIMAGVHFFKDERVSALFLTVLFHLPEPNHLLRLLSSSYLVSSLRVLTPDPAISSAHHINNIDWEMSYIGRRQSLYNSTQTSTLKHSVDTGQMLLISNQQ